MDWHEQSEQLRLWSNIRKDRAPRFYRFLVITASQWGTFLFLFMGITLFRTSTIFCGTDNTLRNILHIQPECEEYFVEYCHFRITLFWIWIMLWDRSKLLDCIVFGHIGLKQIFFNGGLEEGDSINDKLVRRGLMGSLEICSSKSG